MVFIFKFTSIYPRGYDRGSYYWVFHVTESVPVKLHNFIKLSKPHPFY